MERKRKKLSFVDFLCNKETGMYQSPLRLEQQIQRELIESDGYDYRQIFCKKSTKMICFDKNRLHFDHYSTIVSFHGPNLSMKSRNIQKGNARDRVIDALIKSDPYPSCRCRATHCLCFQTYYILLTRDQWLLMCDYDTGAVMDQVDLKIRNDFYDFSEGFWRDEGGQFFLHTEQSPNLLFKVVKSIAVFHASLKFQYMFEITREVFGTFCRDAYVRGHFLITRNDPNMLELYSLDDVLKEGVFRADDLEDSAGTHSSRICKNLEIQRAPPILFKVGLYSDSCNLGGYPYPCLFTSLLFHDMVKSDFPLNYMLKSRGPYEVPERVPLTSLRDVEVRLYHPPTNDLVAFYPISNRVIVQKKDRVQCCEIVNSPPELEEKFEIKFPNLPDSGPPTSKSNEKLVLAIGVESNLNLVAILGTHPNDRSSLGFIKIYDCSFGEEIKTIALKRKLNAKFSYKLHFHSDIIVMIKMCKKESKLYVVNVFGLRRRKDA